MKNQENKFLDHPTTKLVLIFILTLILILISIILFEDLGLDNSMLIYSIFGTLTLVGLLYSFHVSSKKLYYALALGLNRKEYYKKYLKNIGLVLLIALLFIVYYMFAYKLIIGKSNSIFATFDFYRIPYLPILFLCLSFLGFLLGIVKMKKGYLYILAFIITSLVVTSILFLRNEVLFIALLSVLGFLVIILGLLNYTLVKKINL